MSAVKLVGRTTDFKGKTLWEIVGNLKNFGVGRVVVRQMFQRYPEPCYMKIIKVEALPNSTSSEEPRKVKVLVEKVFRGRVWPKPILIESASYKADYQLIPKHREAEICKPIAQPVEKLLPQTCDFPPLLREFIIKETGNPDPKLQMKVKTQRQPFARIANDDENPNIEVTMGLKNAVSPKLFKHLNV